MKLRLHLLPQTRNASEIFTVLCSVHCSRTKKITHAGIATLKARWHHGCILGSLLPYKYSVPALQPWTWTILQVYIHSLPPTAPKMRMKTVTLGEYGEQKSAAEDRRPPAIVVSRQPKQLISTLASGPATYTRNSATAAFWRNNLD